MRRSSALSLPNILTYARIAAVGFVTLFYFVPSLESRWVAVGIYIAAAITDFFDGYLARAWQQQSALGRMLDPIADKLLVSTCLLLMAADGTISGVSIVAAIVILCREILVSGLREFLAELRVSVPVTRMAKWKTTMQLVAVGVLLAGPAGDRLMPYTTDIGLVLLWVSALLTIYTGWDYFRAGIDHLVD
ncbi:CDP-diacylglycerol--glycerol-3-phosphate 3-phosphatidyltransferase [Pseudoxanthobacter soli DSM 19599]|uniref:CDP-diacylglycerol--glycerol-3-phosphate 3-phosphatidyltransferase n=1 Tax=Pseudoxanthobacter soli DSM 19599 TaxID=1123029 RepID=A0A1M7ZGY5_9HYPH|nr:CDP-diacylglycerol--glycerol-3-phosphate 3-phosphatidyltransferase [Pseudoxanthobacter soli]SHO64134.1 CDP-diacylglycerol--glycerol-3-phosphate 3-phosphatidyltransferase [Pseudoxanthobacter soli DSM 19599]